MTLCQWLSEWVNHTLVATLTFVMVFRGEHSLYLEQCVLCEAHVEAEKQLNIVHIVQSNTTREQHSGKLI